MLVTDSYPPFRLTAWPLCLVADALRKVIAHTRHTVFQMAEVALPRDLFRRMLEMIDGLRPRPVARC